MFFKIAKLRAEAGPGNIHFETHATYGLGTSVVQSRTDGRTNGHFENIFFGIRGTKTFISIEISKSIFRSITQLSLYYVYYSVYARK